MHRRRAFAFLLLLIAARVSGANAQQSELLFVENTLGGDVSIVDAAAQKEVGRIAIGKWLDDIIATRAGDVLYMNRMNARSEDGEIQSDGEVLALDPRTRKVLWRVRVSGEPHHITLSRDERLLYVPIFSSNHVEVIDIAQRKVVEKIPVGYGPHTTMLSADGGSLYVGTIHQQHLTIVDTKTHRPIRTIAMGEGVRPFIVLRDQSRAYVQLSRLNGIVEVDPRAGKILRTVNLPEGPSGVRKPAAWPYSVNHGFALTQDEKYLFAAATAGDFVAVYALPALTLEGVIPTGREPGFLTLSRDGRYVYATNRKSNDMSIISVAVRREIARITLGDYPQRIATVPAPVQRAAEGN